MRQPALRRARHQARRPAPFAKADYVARAESLCESAKFDLDRVTANEPADLAAGLNTLDLIVTRIDAVTGDLNALTMDQSDAAELDRIFIEPLIAQGEAARAYRDALRAASQKGPQAVAAVPEPPDPMPAPDLAAMRAYGFDICADLADPS